MVDQPDPTLPPEPVQDAALPPSRPPTLPRAASRGRLGLLRHVDFAKLWTAETVSQFGTQISLFAVPFTAIVFLDANAFQVATLGTVEFLPFLLFTLPAGAWIDRLRRRPILISGDLVRAVSLASIPIAYELGVLTIWQLYVVGFLNGIATVFFDGAYQSYLPALVEDDELIEGNAKLEISRSAAQIAGQPLAGGLVQVFAAPLTILLDSLSYLGSAFFLWRIHKPEPTPQPPGPDGHPSIASEVRAGLRYVLHHRYLRNIAACTGSSNLFSNIAFTLLLLYAVRDLHLEPALIGLTGMFASIGALLGAVSANRLAERFGVGPVIVGSTFLGGFATLLVPLAPPGNVAALYLALSGALGAGFAVIYNVNQVSLRQAITPDAMQGRMNATMRFLVWGTIPIGSMIGGILGSLIGVHATIWVGAILGLGAFLPVFFSPVRGLQRIADAIAEEPPLPDAGGGAAAT
ncbi:MAG: MFS transporter [Candidatus Limnocylindrales bacterium]